MTSSHSNTRLSPETILIAVAWPYANGHLHAGQIAGAYLPADIYARYHRMLGNHTLMVSGSDSHGTPVMTHRQIASCPTVMSKGLALTVNTRKLVATNATTAVAP